METIVNEHDAGRRVALCVVVATRGSTPQPAGAMVCVDEAGHVTGTLGGGCVEADIRRKAHQQLSAGAGRLLTFTLDNDFGHDDGMICGGQMDVAICPIAPEDDIAPYRRVAGGMGTDDTLLPLRVSTGDDLREYTVRLELAPRLLIAGAGHISRLLAEMAVRLGFDVHVIDDRGEYANEKRFPSPVATHVGDIARVLREQATQPDAYVVIVTRGHVRDEAALRAVLDLPTKYLGMIGSRRKIEVIFDDLRFGGEPEAKLARVHAPIGIDIGAVTTAEIAVSVAAELVRVRRQTHRKLVEGPYPVASETA